MTEKRDLNWALDLAINELERRIDSIFSSDAEKEPYRQAAEMLRSRTGKASTDSINVKAGDLYWVSGRSGEILAYTAEKSGTITFEVTENIQIITTRNNVRIKEEK